MKNIKNIIKKVVSGVIFGALSFSATAQAPASGLVLEEIVVTSQLREVSLQDVPVAVTAITGDELELNQINDLLDLQYSVPNISLATNTGTANGARIFLRGVGEDESRASADPAVGIYVDGVYVGRQVGALFDLVDLERVEVLRGPQGTLYGRNSNGGAIKLVSKAPSLAGNAYSLGGTAGSDGRFDVKATGNFVLGDSTALRAAVVNKTRDGFHTLNPNGDFANLAGTEVGELDTTAFRVSLLHNFNEDWSMNVIIDATSDDSDPVPDSSVAGSDGDNDLFTIEPGADATCSAATARIFLGIGCFSDYSSSVDSEGVSVRFTGEVGDLTVSSISGYRSMEDDLLTRIGFPYEQQTDQDQFSQELTLTSNYDGAFNYVTGLFFYREDIVLNSVFVSPHMLDISTDALAAFFQSTYDLTDTVTLATGIRYTDEDKDLFATGPATAPEGFADNVKGTSTQYTLSLSNRFSETVMGYMSVATGFKTGGWSPDCFSSTACFLAVGDEELDSFEIGLRSDLLNNRLRLNGTYFFNQYDGLQIGATVPGLGFTRINAGEAEINGLELEATLLVTEAFSLRMTLGTLDAEYTALTLPQAQGLTNNGASPVCAGVDAMTDALIDCARQLDLKNAPSYKGTIGASYAIEMGGGTLTAGVDVSFEDESYSLVANDPAHALTDPGTLLDTRLTWESNNDWRIAIWGKNLSDEEYARAATARSFAQYAADPMTWGIDFGINF